MNRHLQPSDFVDAVDGQLSAAGRRHLQSCSHCRDGLRDVQQIISDIGGPTAQEPSPLFWEHFSARVRSATRELQPGRASWWRSGWQPVAAMACVVVAVLLAQTVHRAPFGTERSRDIGAAVSSGPLQDVTAATDDTSLTFVASIAAAVSAEELQQAAQPSTDAMDAMVEQLTQEQRIELVRLLNSRMKGSE